MNCFFDILSSITTCCFPSQSDFHAPLFKTIIFVITIIGSCSGSTSGGVKIFRLQILYSILKSHIKKLSSPMDVRVPKYQNEKISHSVTMSVISFCILFVVSGVVSIVLLNMTGIDVEDSAMAVLYALCNAGKNIDIHLLNWFSGLILIVDMIIGRLEIVPVLILMTGGFWKSYT